MPCHGCGELSHVAFRQSLTIRLGRGSRARERMYGEAIGVWRLWRGGATPPHHRATGDEADVNGHRYAAAPSGLN